MSNELPIQLFDPDQPVLVVNRRLPHWSQAGTLTFITWRTWDSIPRTVLAQWLSERDGWLLSHGIDRKSPSWRQQLSHLANDEILEFELCLSNRWNEHLDACHGSCPLKTPAVREIVAQSLMHGDGEHTS